MTAEGRARWVAKRLAANLGHRTGEWQTMADGSKMCACLCGRMVVVQRDGAFWRWSGSATEYRHYAPHRPAEGDPPAHRGWSARRHDPEPYDLPPEEIERRYQAALVEIKRRRQVEA